MADFKSAQITNVTGTQTLITATVPTIIIGFHIANTSASNITVDIHRDLGLLGKDIPIPTGSTLIPFEGKMVLEVGEAIGLTPSIDASCDATISYLEL